MGILEHTTVGTDRALTVEEETKFVKEMADFAALLRELSIEMNVQGNYFMVLCPFHDDHVPSCSIDRDKNRFHCFGCGVKGDIFDFVMKVVNCSFPEAKSFLMKSQNLRPVGNKIETKQVVEQRSGSRKSVALSITLTDVCRLLLSNFEKNISGRDYLEARGIVNPRLFQAHWIGFSDGSLSKIASKKQLADLVSLGVVNARGKELFYDSVVIPMFDENEQVVSFYGRKVSSCKPAHLFSPGPHAGMFNPKAPKVFDEIILTESPIDALSLLQVGLDNVQSIFGVHGFTSEHLQFLKDCRVKSVVLGLDNDEEGLKAADRLKDLLLADEFAVKVVVPPHGKDWNEWLVSGGQKDDLCRLIDEAEVFKAVTDREDFVFARERDAFHYEINGTGYRLLGIKDLSAAGLSVGIRVLLNGDSFNDRCDLYSAASRKRFCNCMAEALFVEPERVLKDLNRILDHLEEVRNERLTVVQDEVDKMSSRDREMGLNFLKDPGLIEATCADLEALGVVGEAYNKMLIFFAALSRFFPDPLSVYIQSCSAAGKSHLLEVIKKVIPPEDIINATSFSDNALYYFDEDMLLNKVFFLGETKLQDEVEEQIRQMQSEHILSRWVAQKDEASGENRTNQVIKKVVLAFMMTSTILALDEQNRSRCLLLHVDESRDQTLNVLEAQREKCYLDRLLLDESRNVNITQKHLAAQRLLEPVNIFDPLSKFLRFPADRTTRKREQMQFLVLRKAICFFRQMQKKRVVIDNEFSSKGFEGILCDLDEYRFAYDWFMYGVLVPNRNEIPIGARRLYEAIRKMAKAEAGKKSLKATDISFIQQEVRELTSLGAESVKRYMRILVENEYLQLLDGRRHGTRLSYRLREDRDLESVDFSVIPTPAEMARLVEQDKENLLHKV